MFYIIKVYLFELEESYEVLAFSLEELEQLIVYIRSRDDKIVLEGVESRDVLPDLKGLQGLVEGRSKKL